MYIPMRKYRFIINLFVFLLGGLLLKAQSIKPEDFKGRWVLNDNENEIYFFDSLNILVTNGTLGNKIYQGHFSITKKDPEYVLTLNLDSTGISVVRMYLIRKRGQGEYWLKKVMKDQQDKDLYTWKDNHGLDFLDKIEWVKYSVP
jgi:hypothetical protein